MLPSDESTGPHTQRPRIRRCLLKDERCLLRGESRLELQLKCRLFCHLTTLRKRHLAINWILTHWRAANQAGSLIEVMSLEEQMQKPDLLYLRDDVVGGKESKELLLSL